MTKAWTLAVGLFVIACGDDPRIELPAGETSSSALELPMKETSERIALCDNAPIGTPCGKRGSHMYCVAQVCVRNVCGDGVKAELEECDDGNQRDGDSCSAQCRAAGAGADSECGNGEVEVGEACDDGNKNEQDGCNNRCRLARNTPMPEAGMGVPRAGDSAAGGAGVSGALAGLGGMAAVGGTGGVAASAGTGAAGSAGSTAGSSATPTEACRACRETHCRSYGMLDVVSGCLERVDLTQGADAQDAKFIDDCTGVVACAISNRCADTIFGAQSCYCGAANSSECAATGPRDAKCLAQIQRATRSIVPSEVLARMRLKSYPIGWANDLLECDRLHCGQSCRP